MPDYSYIARELISLHDTDADPSLVDNAIELATRLDIEGDDAPLHVGEDFFSLMEWLGDYMDEDLRDEINEAEMAFMVDA